MRRVLFSSILLSQVLLATDLPKYELGILGSGITGDSDLNMEFSTGYGVEVGKKLSENSMINLSFLKGDIDYDDGVNSSEYESYLLNQEFYLNSESSVVPYFTFGLGYINFDNEMYDNQDNFLADYGFGLRYNLHENLNLKVNVKHIHTLSDSNNYYIASAGVALTFGREKEPVVVDSDGDGILDNLDECPNTPKGVKVNSKGCPLDSDKDGVLDYLDYCPNTPEGVEVDSKGCAIDSDYDGVADYLDKCANTPLGIKVDESGCPPDSDGDGVLNYLDKCPNTPAGFEVDKDGCELSYSFEVYFNTNSYQLLNTSIDSIKSFTNFLDKNAYSAIIAGHTDSVGSAKYNQKLSEKRAEAVYKKIIELGISKDRLSYIGYGESKPIVDNSTKENRAKNRRVEATLEK
jgi:OOP family OmpA-OmpF porin